MSPKSFLSVLLLALMAIISGCATEPGGPSAAGAPPKKHVMIFGHPPKQPYVELGTVRDVETYRSDGMNSSNLALAENVNILDVLREKAAAMGADAVILKEQRVADPDDPSTSQFSTHIWLQGVAIRFLPTPATPAP